MFHLMLLVPERARVQIPEVRRSAKMQHVGVKGLWDRPRVHFSVQSSAIPLREKKWCGSFVSFVGEFSSHASPDGRYGLHAL